MQHKHLTIFYTNNLLSCGFAEFNYPEVLANVYVVRVEGREENELILPVISGVTDKNGLVSLKLKNLQPLQNEVVWRHLSELLPVLTQ